MEYIRRHKSSKPVSERQFRGEAPQAVVPNSALLPLLQNVSSESSNVTGLPDAMKARMERLTGVPLDDVRVHRDSSKPAELGAAAYAKGSEIHLGPGQEEHLSHELGHVVQQKTGRVKPAFELNGEKINDDASLEEDADEMGEANAAEAPKLSRPAQSGAADVVQRELIAVGNTAPGQTEVIGINAMPSFGRRTWTSTIGRLWGAGVGNASSLYAGHSSVISGSLNAGARLNPLAINPVTDVFMNPAGGGDMPVVENVPNAQSGPSNSVGNMRAHGFSPRGMWNSLMIGLNRFSFGLLGSKTVQGGYHNDRGVTGDPLSRTLTTKVTPQTRTLWDQLASQDLDMTDTSGIYSFNPTTRNKKNARNIDNCTTIALRRAHTICNELIDGMQDDNIDKANIITLRGELNRLIDAIAERGRGEEGNNMQGRLMGALHTRYGD